MLNFPIVLINTASIILIAIVIICAWRKRSNMAVTQFIIACFFMIIWAVSSFAEMAAADMAQKILWRNITQIGVFFVPPASLFFSITYSGILKKKKKGLIYLIYSVQAVSVLLIFTDGWHHLMRRSIALVQTSVNAVITVESTLLGMLLISLNFIYMTASLILLIVYAVRTTKNMRKQVLIMIVGMGIAVLYSLIKVASGEQIGTFLPISGVFAMVSLTLLLGIFKYDFLSVLPVARDEVLNVINEGILICSVNGDILDANKAAIRMFSGDTSQHMRNADGFAAINALLQRQYPDWYHILVNCQPCQLNISQQAAHQMYYYHCNTYVLNNNKNRAIGTISVIRDITQQKIKNDLLKHRAEYDSLIDIYNRHTFIERVDHELMIHDTEASLIFFDLDDFKVINDNHGHVAGDYVLKKVCSCIKQKIGKQSIIGRMGGEEFAIFFKGTSNSHSLNIAEQLRKKVEETAFLFDGKKIDVTISAGIATGRGVSFVQLYREADKMLYRAKEAGKNCVRPSLVPVPQL